MPVLSAFAPPKDAGRSFDGAPHTLSLRADSNLHRRVRCFALVALLTGSLFPLLLGIDPLWFGLVLALPLLIFEIFQALPRWHAVVAFAIPLFLLLAAKGLLEAPSNTYGQDKLARMLTLTLLSALAAGLIRDETHLETFALLWLGAGCILAVASITGVSAGQRSRGFDSNPVWLADALALALVIAVWAYWGNKMPFRVLLAVGPLLGWALYLTGSRGPTMAAAAGIATLAVVLPGARAGRLLALVLAGSGAFAMLTTSTAGSQSRIGQFLVDPTSEVSTTTRLQLWKLTAEVITHNKWGVGLGNWSQAAHGYPFIYPHNMFLEVLAESGWFVGVILIATTGLVIWRLMRRARHSRAAGLLLAMVVTITVASSLSGDINSRTFFALLTMGYLASRWPTESSRAWSHAAS